MCIVSNGEWKMLFGMKVNTLYQVFSAALVKAVVHNIGRAADKIALANAATQHHRRCNTTALRMNTVACTLDSARRNMDSAFD